MEDRETKTSTDLEARLSPAEDKMDTSASHSNSSGSQDKKTNKGRSGTEKRRASSSLSAEKRQTSKRTRKETVESADKGEDHSDTEDEDNENLILGGGEEEDARPFHISALRPLSTSDLTSFLSQPKAAWITSGRPKYPKAGEVYLIDVKMEAETDEVIEGEMLRLFTLDGKHSWRSGEETEVLGEKGVVIISRSLTLNSPVRNKSQPSADSKSTPSDLIRYEAWKKDDENLLLVHYYFRNSAQESDESNSNEIPANSILSASKTTMENGGVCDARMEEETPTPVQTKFTLGQLVWAKVKGWPWWPCVVEAIKWMKVPGKGPLIYRVEFFGTEEEAMLKADCLKTYDAKTRIQLGKPRRTRHFNQAIYQAEQLYRQNVSSHLHNKPSGSMESNDDDECTDRVIELLEYDLRLKEALGEGAVEMEKAKEVLQEIEKSGLLSFQDVLLRSCPIVLSLLKIRGWKEMKELHGSVEEMLGKIGGEFGGQGGGKEWLREYERRLGEMMEEEPLYKHFYEPIFTGDPHPHLFPFRH